MDVPGESKMIELDFVDDTLLDHRKDHDTQQYHISMVEDVYNGEKYDEIIIKFQTEIKSYFATLPLQRNFIVEMI